MKPLTMTDTPFERAAAIMRHYGARHQKIKFAEELSELIQALCKSLENPESPDINADIVEEMADVKIMMMQFISIFGVYWQGEFDKTVGEKLTRQEERIMNESPSST